MKLSKLKIQDTEKTLAYKDFPTVYCNDVSGLVQLLIKMNIIMPEKQLIKIAVDGGGGSLKFCMNIIDLEKRFRTDIDIMKEKKWSYSSSFAHDYNDNSVLSSILILVAPDVPERYYNMEVLFKMLHLETISYTCVCDIKLCQILAGLSPSSRSIHPCYICEWDRKDPFQNREYRTFGNCEENLAKFRENGSKPLNAQRFMNCINPILVDGKSDEKVVDILVIPELYVMEGTVNYLVTHMETHYTKMKELYDKLNIAKAGQHAGKFNGNPCRKILKNWEIFSHNVPPAMSGFAECLRLLDSIVAGCFGVHFNPECEESFAEIEIVFKQLMEDFELNVTPKFHILFSHVLPFCKERGYGLGILSEQAGESVHFDFNMKSWSRFKVSTNNSRYPEQILKAVVSYNGKHVTY